VIPSSPPLPPPITVTQVERPPSPHTPKLPPKAYEAFIPNIESFKRKASVQQTDDEERRLRKKKKKDLEKNEKNAYV